MPSLAPWVVLGANHLYILSVVVFYCPFKVIEASRSGVLCKTFSVQCLGEEQYNSVPDICCTSPTRPKVVSHGQGIVPEVL